MKLNFTTIVFLVVCGVALILGGLLGWSQHVVHKQKATITELEQRIETIIAAGSSSGPVWVAPWETDPDNPTQTPTENTYAEALQDFIDNFEGIEDEKIFTDYATTDSVSRRDELVAGYSDELKLRLQNRIDNFTE